MIIGFYVLRQYFVIGIKDGPVEIWDLKSMSLLSKMSKRFPPAVCMVNILKCFNINNYNIYILLFFKEWVQCNMSKSKNYSSTTPIIEGI